jgi:hypothetical protein
MALQRADAAQVCSNASFVLADGQCECCSATAARQIVSEPLWEGGGLKQMCLSATSAFDPIQKQTTGLMLHSDAAQVCSNVGLVVYGQLEWPALQGR